MARFGHFSRFLAVCAAILMVVPATAFAAEGDDVGWPYRGPQELRGGSGDSDEDEEDDSGDGNEDPNENPNENPNETPDTGGTTGPGPGGPGAGKKAAIVGDILWSWWWEYNKDRFLARATERGRVNAGSTLYWFGAGAKYPPRDITPVSDSQKRQIFAVLNKRLEDKSLAVRKAACIALGRLGVVAATEEEVKADEKASKNMCARALLNIVREAKDPDLRNHAILGLGLTGDEVGAVALLQNYKDLPSESRSSAIIAFGLARAPEAIETIVQAMPKSNKSNNETELAAIHALGLYGPEFVPEIEKAKDDKGKKNGMEMLEDFASAKSGNDQVPEQAITALARLQTGVKTVGKGVRHKSLPVKNAAILALASYSANEKDSASAWKALKGGFKGSQQTKNFVILTSGDLAGQLDDNSKTRAAILKWLHDKKQLGSNDNYTRACSVMALAVANDQAAVPAIAALLENKTIDHYVAGACSVALGLLKATDKADLVLKRVVNGKFNADSKGYGLIGLALMGDTTRVEAVIDAAKKIQQKEAQRQAPLAIGVLGDRLQTRTLTSYFSKKWKQKDRFQVSNAAFGLGWIRDADSVESLLKLASTSPEFSVRAMAVIALGYVGASDRVTGLTRCFTNANYKKKFNGFKTLDHISSIL
ncbi:MAG: HEAT repeat domain-containing protein [Planctomycetota bacterium]|jgi:HEAT repeat protein